MLRAFIIPACSSTHALCVGKNVFQKAPSTTTLRWHTIKAKRFFNIFLYCLCKGPLFMCMRNISMSEPKRQIKRCHNWVFLCFRFLFTTLIYHIHRSSTEIWGLWSICENGCAWIKILWNMFSFQNKPHWKFEESYWIKTFSRCIYLSMSWMQNCSKHQQSLFGAQKQISHVTIVIVSDFRAIKWNEMKIRPALTSESHSQIVQVHSRLTAS